jgi:protein-disulfide isomerase
MGIKSNYKLLPSSTKKLLNIGIILALVVALPLFVWSIINMTFDIRERAQNQNVSINLVNQPFLGFENSPVTIVMYSDFQCEFCKYFIDNTLSTILSNYPNEVKFVHKDFPLAASHPLAQKAALASECSYKQNKFWEMHSMIFENQATLAEGSFSQFATTIGLNKTTFEACMTSQEALDEVNADYNEGLALGIVGTPTFYVNNIKIEGSQTFEVFRAVINQELLPSPTPTATISATVVSSPTVTASSTATTSPTMTATATPTPYVEPEPNSCGGTCGSNYNCKANLYCYQGFCRNPICSTDSDCDCITITATPTATAKTTSASKGSIVTSVAKNKTATPKSSPKATPNYTGGMTLIEKPEELKRENDKDETTQPENMFVNQYAVYIVAGLGLIVLTTIIYALKKKRDNSIPHIVPPTNI